VLKFITNLFNALCILIVVCASASLKANAFSIIRDAEIENTIALFAKPVFEAAGLTADHIQIYLVNDDQLNAFVAGGQKLFIHTGLLQKSRTPEQVIGVIAHETGHIAGGHLARLKQKLEKVSPEAILGYVLGGAAILAGQGDAGGLVIAGGQEMAQRSLLSYSRMEEGSADQAALKYLDQRGISSKGFLEFFQILERNSRVSSANQNPYIRSHPLTTERIEAVRDHLKTSPYTNNRVSKELIEKHARMRAKLDSFIYPSTYTFRLYPKNKTDIASRYAHAWAYHKDNNTDRALETIEGLINERPNDPYFQELKGQILFENGYVQQSIDPYEKAARLLPDAAQISLALGRSYLESGDEGNLLKATKILEKTVFHERNNSFAWRQLGIAYGKMGQTAQSSLALAEEAYLKRLYKEAVFLAGRAEKEFKTGSREWLQAQDLRLSAERLMKKQQKANR
jgi:predicted Zn-dependent protease